MRDFHFSIDGNKLRRAAAAVGAILFVVLCYAVVNLSREVHDLHAFIKLSAQTRDHQHQDQHTIDCEITHKLNIYTGLCGEGDPATTTTSTTAP
jgi:hypothetical protein